MALSQKLKASLAEDAKNRESDQRASAWICFVLALVVAPLAYARKTPHWPYAVVGLAFATGWLLWTVSKSRRPKR